MTILVQQIKGDIKSHILLTQDIATADFEATCTKIEDFYRNVYTNDATGSVGALRGKKGYRKGKGWQTGYGKG
eukprot:6476229-Amphidinium_carterae.1